MAGQGACEALARAFERNPVFGHVHAWDLYRNWLEAVWAFLAAAHDPAGYRACLDRYSYGEGAEFGRLLGLYVNAVEEAPFRDVLGEVFMRLDINSVHAGQYFTPWDIAVMMARMQFDAESYERTACENGVVTVCDPACGSGVMLLAFASVVHEALGRTGTARLGLYGQDIDIRCVNMCRIQLRMNGLDAFGRMAGLVGVQAPVVKYASVEPLQIVLPGFAA